MNFNPAGSDTSYELTSLPAKTDQNVENPANKPEQHLDVPRSSQPPQSTDEPDESFFAGGWRLFFILSSLLLSIFCEAVDETIIATAIPRITDHFHRLGDVGWYGSAYLLTNAAFQLFFGKLYRIFPLRWVFMASLSLFEIGCLISATAPSSNALIAGRAVAGTGAAGLTGGALTIMAYTSPLRWRALFVSCIGVVYGVASVAGPVIGGALAQDVTWRWNFYVNLPIGGVAALVLNLLLKHLPPSSGGKRLTVLKALRRLDPIGTAFFVGSVVSLLIALQWGGTTYAWSLGRMVALLVVFAVFIVAFVLVQGFQTRENATIPTDIIRNRSMAFGAWFAFCQGAAFNLYVFYLPLYFQIIKNATPIMSGVDYLPLILINTVAIIVSGVLTTRFGYYMPWIWASSILMPIGAGLLTLMRVDSSASHWIGFQILFAIGSGLGLQQPFIAAQAILPLQDISTGVGLMLFAQLGGGAIFVSVAQSVFAGQVTKRVPAMRIPGLDAEELVSLGPTQFRQIVPTADLKRVLEAYNTSLIYAYRVGLVMACLSVLGPLGMKWVSVKPEVTSGKDDLERTEASRPNTKVLKDRPSST